MQERIEFELIDWELYFGMLQQRLTSSSKNQSRQSGAFTITMQALQLEFNQHRYKEAYAKYIQAQNLLQPFAAYRLAEIHLKPNKFDHQPDFEVAWFYLIKAATLNSIRYAKDVLNAKAKLTVYINSLDPSLVNSLRIVDSYQQANHAQIIKNCFKLVFNNNQEENAQIFLVLIKNIEQLLKKSPASYLVELLINLITSKIQLKYKPMEPILELLLKNTVSISLFIQDQYNMLLSLVLCPRDSIILSSIRDNLIEIVYLSKIFKFAITDKDVNMLQVQDCLFKSYQCLFNNLDRVSLLQDRIFISYYLAQMLYCQGKKDDWKQALTQLQSLVNIKSIAGTEGFYYYLRGNIEKNNQYLRKSAECYQKEPQNEDNRKMIVFYYLSRIESKFENAENSQSYLHQAYQIYVQNHTKWYLTTLQTICYFKKICRKLKKLRFYTIPKPPQYIFDLTYIYGASSDKIYTKCLKAQIDLKQFDYRQIIPTKTLAKLPSCSFIQALIDGNLCIVQQFPIMAKHQKEDFIRQLEQKHNTLHQNLQRIVGYSSQQKVVQERLYSMASVVYQMSVLYSFSNLECQIRELSKIVSAYNFAEDQIDENCLLKAYSMNKQLVVLGWAASKAEDNHNKDIGLTLCSILGNYNLEFLSRIIGESSLEELEKYLDNLFIRI